MESESGDLCPNCGHPLKGPFCFDCGQRQRNIRRLFLSLVSEAFEDLFSLNSRTSRTLGNLMVRPGFLTNEYSAGRRARYIPPLRLYLISIFLFVLFLSLINMMTAAEEYGAELNTEADKIIITDDEGIEAEITQEEFSKNVTEHLNEMRLPWLSEANNSKVRTLLKNQSEKAYRMVQEDPGDLLNIVFDLIPLIMFLLLPLFALLLKVTYITSGRYYTEHLVLALYNHSFLFFSLLINNLMELLEDVPVVGVIADGISIVIVVWIPLYLFMTLKACYGEGIAVTLFKYLFLSFSYILLLSLVMSIAALWGFLTL